LWTGPADRVPQHEVGEYEVSVPLGDNAKPTGLQWLPADRKVSFALNGKLWTVRSD